jgi:hypothetical protein
MYRQAGSSEDATRPAAIAHTAIFVCATRDPPFYSPTTLNRYPLRLGSRPSGKSSRAALKAELGVDQPMGILSVPHRAARAA